MALNSLAQADYPAYFRAGVQRALARTLQQVMACIGPLPPALCAQAFHILQFGLNLADNVAVISSSIASPTVHTDQMAQADDGWPVLRQLLLLLAPQMEQAGYREEWRPYLEGGLALSQRKQDVVVEAELIFQLGYLLQLRSELDAAATYYQQSAMLFVQVNQPLSQAKALNRLAFVFLMRRRFAELPPLLNQVQTLLTPNEPELSSTKSIEGWLAFSQHQWPESLAYFQQARALAEKAGRTRQAARCLRDCASALQMMGRYSEAIHNYALAIEQLAQLQDPFEEAVARMNLGTVYLQLQQPDQALHNYQRAKAVFLAVNDPLHLAQLYTNIGIAQRDLGQLTAAEQALLTSTALWQRLDNQPSLANALSELGLTYLARGDHDQALAQLRQAKTYLSPFAHQAGYAHQLQEIDQALVRVLGSGA